MGVFKEHARAFETVAKKQKQIWADAADYGFPYDTKNPSNEIEALIYYARDLKGTSLMRKREVWDGGVTITFRIGWEIDEGMECGTQYVLSFVKISQRQQKNPDFLCKGCDAFISVDIDNYREPYRNR